MLGKLIKHELRATGRTMLPLFAVLSVMSVVAGFSMRHLEFSLTQMPAFVEIVLMLLFAAFFIVMVATIVMAFVIMISRFYKNLLGDEGYLMLTLPVNAHSHVWAKLIVSTIWFIATAVLIVLLMCLLALIISGSDIAGIIAEMPTFKEMFAQFLDYSGYNGLSLTLFIVEFILLTVVGVLNTCLNFYAAMAIGHSFSNRKILYSVLAFVGISIVFSIFESVLALFMGENFGESIMLNYRNFAYSLNWLMLQGLLLSVVETIPLYFITTYCLKKRINLA